MITHDVMQGTPEWDALRFKFDCASDAPIIMGASPHLDRATLLRFKATGDEKSFSQFVREKVLDAGHEVEPTGRAVVAAFYGEDFYPIVGSNGTYLASFDGINMEETRSVEVKLLNAALLKFFQAGYRDALEPLYYWQMEHQLLVSDAKFVVFCITDGTDDNTFFFEYRPVEGRRETLVAAWDQFHKDVAAYKHEDVYVKPAAAVIRALPALVVQVEGKVLKSNLPALRNEAAHFLAQIKTALETDEDFVNAENQVKFLKAGEDNWEVTKKAVQAQMASVDDLFRAGDEIAATFRSKRLELGKIVDAEKIRRRAEILRAGKELLDAHLASLNERISPLTVTVSVIMPFAGAVKGKKNIDSIKAAVSQALADAKIEANAMADKIDANLRRTAGRRQGYEFLFMDLQGVMSAAPETCDAIVESRIAKHDASQKAKAEADAEAARAKIRAEEEAKAKAALREQQDRLQEEIRENDRIARVKLEAAERARGQYDMPQVSGGAAGGAAQPSAAGSGTATTIPFFGGPASKQNNSRAQFLDILDSGRAFSIRNVSATQFVVTLL